MRASCSLRSASFSSRVGTYSSGAKQGAHTALRRHTTTATKMPTIEATADAPATAAAACDDIAEDCATPAADGEGDGVGVGANGAKTTMDVVFTPTPAADTFSAALAFTRKSASRSTMGAAAS